MARPHERGRLAARARSGRLRLTNGPKSPQERWENQDGWSPNTIATEIAGLICAADIARRNGDEARAEQYEATADEWEQNVEDWTATDSTEYSHGRTGS